MLCFLHLTWNAPQLLGFPALWKFITSEGDSYRVSVGEATRPRSGTCVEELALPSRWGITPVSYHVMLAHSYLLKMS